MPTWFLLLSMSNRLDSYSTTYVLCKGREDEDEEEEEEEEEEKAAESRKRVREREREMFDVRSTS